MNDDVMIKKLTIDESGMKARLTGEACRLFAQAMAADFIDAKAENYLELTFVNDEVGELVVTLQKKSGITPAGKVEQIKQLIRDGRYDEALSV
jgi:hypothetical protein